MSSDSVTYLAAFGGGVVSFASPCVLPLVPAYLSLVTGLEVSEIEEPSRRHLGRVTRDTGLFVAGFSAVFILLGITATGLGQFFARNQLLLTRVSGAMVLGFALFLAGSLILRAPWLYGEKRFQPQLSRFGPYAAPVAGAAFAFGWTPCIGPVLGSVLAVASTRDGAAAARRCSPRTHSGSGCPSWPRASRSVVSRTFAWVKRHFTAITLTSAISLAVFGTLLVLDRLRWLTSQLQSALRGLGLDSLVNLG